jgi:fumarate hydratase subunit alpha
MAVEINYNLPEDVERSLILAKSKEVSPQGLQVLDELIENAGIAKEGVFPLCQDTGFAVVFLEVGQDVHFVGANLKEAVEDGVRMGYKEGYLRKSICHPFTRKNTSDNTPAVIHTEIVPGDRVKLTLVAKGGGSENMSRVTMLAPSDGWEGVKRFIVKRAEEAGSNPCPPIIVGVGIGGTFEKAALLAKKALLRKVGEPSADPEVARMEQELFEAINALGVGPQGLGGRVTTLGVMVEMMPCHIASLPVAVNIQCHSARHKSILI